MVLKDAQDENSSQATKSEADFDPTDQHQGPCRGESNLTLRRRLVDELHIYAYQLYRQSRKANSPNKSPRDSDMATPEEMMDDFVRVMSHKRLSPLEEEKAQIFMREPNLSPPMGLPFELYLKCHQYLTSSVGISTTTLVR